MKRTTKPFATKVESGNVQHYSQREINKSIRGMTRELRSCPEDKITNLLNVIKSMTEL